VKNYPRNKSSTITNSQNQNQLLLNTENKKYDEIFEKKMENSQNKIHFGESSLADFNKIEAIDAQKASESLKNNLKEEKIL
jgi:hypothetical protein